MANAWRICQQMGITLHSWKKDAHPRILPPKHTWARKAIVEAAERGERAGEPEHVYDCLSLFLSSTINSAQMYGDTISGVSRWMLKSGVNTRNIGAVKASFKEIDLSTIRATVVHYGFDQRSQQIALLIAGEMEPEIQRIVA